MGWQEKHNPNSEWYKKRHPQPKAKSVPVIEKPKKLSVWQKIKKFFCIPE